MYLCEEPDKNEDMENDGFKTVMRYSDPISAHIAEGMLLSNGIPAAVFGEVSPYPSANLIDAIELKVRTEDYDAALALLTTPYQEDK